MIIDRDADIVVDDLPAAHRSLRVTVVTETYPPEVNGVATTICRVVDGLRARGHAMQLVRPRQGPGDQGEPAGDGSHLHEVLMRGLPIPRYPQLKMGLPAKGALVRLWAQQRPDLVHIATEGPLGWSALQAATKLRLPVVSDYRTNFHAYSQHYGVGWLHKPIMAYMRKFHNRTRLTMVPTAQLRDELTAAGIRPVVVVARGVDTGLFDPARRNDALRATWGAGADTLVVLCVGRLAPEKNLGALVDAFAAVRALRPDSRLVLVGGGPQRRELQARCPGAVFAGIRAGDDLAAHYASADLFAFPSLTETFGNVTPEAMASGLAVLAYDYAAAARLIRDGVSGVLVPLQRAGEFTLRAVALAADPARARAMGLAAREAALQHSWDRIFAELECVYLSALSDAPVLQGSALRYA